MQCNWQPLASLASRGFARPWSIPQPQTVHSFFARRRNLWATHVGTHNSLTNSFSQTQRRQYASVLHSTHPPPPSAATNTILRAPNQLESTPPTIPYNAAQKSRAVSAAVRISIREGNLNSAHLIVRALYHARLPTTTTVRPIQQFLGAVEGTQIPLDSSVSPRLAAHTLLHGLIRVGEHQHAANLAKEMMENGTRVRCASLEIILRALHDASVASPPSLLSPMFSLKTIKATEIRPHMRENAHITEAALLLVQAARNAGQHSSRRMYRYLMTLCIINGEIILASLIFGVLVREWQARQQAKQVAAVASVPSDHPVPFVPQPRLEDLRPILQVINWNLALPQTDETSQVAFSASLQALANIAGLMDRGQLLVNLEPVIAAIYKCPRSTEQVWIPGKKKGYPSRQVDGYTYLNFVLDRLIFSLPDEEYGGKPRKGAKAVPAGSSSPREWQQSEYAIEPMNPWAYNSLLNYSLRHRHSIRRALIVLTRLLEHPEADRPENMTAMYNVLERARHDFPVSMVTNMMKSVGLSPPDPDALVKLVSCPPGALDRYAISTQISSLTKAGRNWDVVKALPVILPGLYAPETPKGVPLGKSQAMKESHRKEGLARAVELGPVVFCSLLDAIRRCGKTGLAEKVFLYGLEAEEKSFYVTSDVAKPWCLPVHAYTTMLQVYRNERGKVNGAKRYAVGWGLTPDGERINWTDRDVAPVRRAELAGRMIMLIYESMMAAPQVISERLAALEARLAVDTQSGIDFGPSQLVPPAPDHWFFETMVDIFKRTPADPLFPSLLRAMKAHGFAVSDDTQNLLRDHWDRDTVGEILSSGPGDVKVRRELMPLKMWGSPRKQSVVGRLGTKRWPNTHENPAVKQSRAILMRLLSKGRTPNARLTEFAKGRAAWRLKQPLVPVRSEDGVRVEA